MDAAIIKQKTTLKHFTMKLRLNNLCYKQSNFESYGYTANGFHSKTRDILKKLAAGVKT